MLKQVSGGTQCQYVVQSDLKGSIPSSIVNMVSSNQPMVLANISKALEALKTPSFKSGILGGKKFGYQDFKRASNYTGPSLSVVAAGGGGVKSSVKQTATSDTAASSQPSDNNSKSAGGTSNPSTEKVTHRKTGKQYMLFFPVILYYISPSHYRALGFLVGFLIAVRYLLRQHLGDAKVVVASNMGQVLHCALNS